MANIYRRNITVTNNEASTLTDFQTRIINFNTAALVTAGKMRSDCGDLRIYDADGTTALDFWVIPETINTSTTELWIKIPTLTTSGKTIYFEYGDLTLTSVSNIFNTMITGDDFADNSISRMTVEAGTWSVSGGILKQTVFNSTSNAVIKPNTNPTHSDIMAEARMRMVDETSGDNLMGLLVRNNDTTGGVDNSGYVGQIGSISGTDKAGIERFTQAHLATANFTVNMNTWYKLSFRIYGNTKKVFVDSSEKISETSDSNYSSGKFLIRLYQCKADIDWFYVRKHTLNEPSTTIGSEYNITIIYSIQKNANYKILTDNILQKDLLYRVKHLKSIQKVIIYRILRTIDALTKGMQYEIAPPTLIALALGYKILTMIGIQKDLAYAIVLEQVITKQMAYSIITQGLLQKDLEYVIRLFTSITKSMEYVLAFNANIQLGLRYEVGVGGYIYKYTQRNNQYNENYKYTPRGNEYQDYY